MGKKLNLAIIQGSTFTQEVRWETKPLVYKAITGITKSAPMTVTVPSHDAPPGWRGAIASVRGMEEANDCDPLERNDHEITVIDDNTIQFNDVNALEFESYISGGVLMYYTPVDLTGFTARMTIKDRVGGTVLDTLTSVNGKIIIDVDDSLITIELAASATALYTWLTGVYDLELVSSTGVVTSLLNGSVKVQPEVTT